MLPEDSLPTMDLRQQTLRCREVTFNVPTIGSTSTTDAPFSMTVAGSFFEMTGGTIIIKQPGGSSLGFLNTGSAEYSVTGGTVQIGDASTPGG